MGLETSGKFLLYQKVYLLLNFSSTDYTRTFAVHTCLCLCLCLFKFTSIPEISSHSFNNVQFFESNI